MGLYINQIDGKSIGRSFQEKVNNLKVNGATETDATFKANLICVIDNYMFAAAAYCYSEREFREFNSQQKRKTWLVLSNAKKHAN